MLTSPISTAKRLLVRTPAYRILLDLRARNEDRAVWQTEPSAMRSTRCYCASPYKTGTTYIASLFDTHHRARHEPFHYATLKRIDDIDFLSRRASLLALDLECSGFFANRLEVLRTLAPTAPILYLSRSPEEWIGSVVNYFTELDNSVAFNYVARLFFDPICHEPIERFYTLDGVRQQHVVASLLELWIRIYERAATDRRVLTMPLVEVDDRLQEIEEFFHLRSSRRNVRRRTNSNKRSFRLGDHIDTARYRERVAALGYGI